MKAGKRNFRNPDDPRPADAAETPGATGRVEKTMTGVSSEQRLRMIEVAAYFLAERRCFGPGHELDDWLKAQSEIDRQLSESQ